MARVRGEPEFPLRDVLEQIAKDRQEYAWRTETSRVSRHLAPPKPKSPEAGAIRHRIVKALRDGMVRTGRPPTLREVAEAAGISIPDLDAYLRSMEKSGRVVRLGGSHRAWLPSWEDGCCSACGRPLPGR